MSRCSSLLAILVVLSILAAACGGGAGDGEGGADVGDDRPASEAGEVPEPAPTASSGVEQDSAWYRPGARTTWQWQLSGEIDTSYDVDLYDVDLFDTPAATIDALHADGRRVICYFSAGTAEEWRDDFAAFPAEVVGNAMEDWEGEFWLDVGAPAVLAVHETRLDQAATKGCDGVEPDNVAGYDDDTGFGFTREDQVGFNRALAEAAHARGLAVALKNSPDLVADLVDGFDFAVTEECHEYDECETYAPFVEQDKPVLNAEYADRWVTDESARAAMCAEARALRIQTLVLPLDLDNEFRFACG